MEFEQNAVNSRIVGIEKAQEPGREEYRVKVSRWRHESYFASNIGRKWCIQSWR